jgi:hypothetical protein
MVWFLLAILCKRCTKGSLDGSIFWIGSSGYWYKTRFILGKEFITNSKYVKMRHATSRHKTTMNKISRLLQLSVLLSTLSAQLNYTGEINLSVMTRTSDQSQINLPFRLLSLNLGYTIGSLDIKTVPTIEYRYDSSKSTYDLWEAYLAYYPEWGEIKFGKQIHAWGLVDGNNPTDNINPYDYYYLFKQGTGQKIGTFSFSAKLYFRDYQLEAIIIPKHEANRIPSGEKDYPLGLPLEQTIDYPVVDEIEVGMRLQKTIGEIDFGVSMFNGHDRTPSVSTISFMEMKNGIIPKIPKLGYRATSVLGLDFVAFIGDLTIRGEGAFFKTKSSKLDLTTLPIPGNLFEIDQEISYSQFVIQTEYTTVSDIMILGQLISSSVNDEQYSIRHLLTGQIEPFFNSEFRPGMGTPFAMFSDLALIVGSSGILMDDRLEIKGNAMMNLDGKGVMISVSTGYSPWMNWKFELGLIQFKGDKENLGNVFTKMEDFSHIRLGLFYNF